MSDCDLALDDVVSEKVMTDAREHDDAAVAVRAVLVVEMMHQDGDTYLHTLRPEGTTSWQAVGMLEFAKRTFLHHADVDDDE